MSDDVVDTLIQWFTRNGGVFGSECVGFRYDDESGRGAFALSDIPEGQVLFTIPRYLLLSTRTCDLREQLGENAWKRLGAGWAGLILCMMWEQAKGSDGKWSAYFGWQISSRSSPFFFGQLFLYSHGLILLLFIYGRKISFLGRSTLPCSGLQKNWKLLEGPLY
jgi:N-lysine methyltransferase SETD6